MDWYWWLLIAAAGYAIGGVYVGTRFRQWGRHTLCTSRYYSGAMCDDCNVSTGWAVAFWPIAVPPLMFITWLYRTAKRQSRIPRKERQLAKLAEETEVARATKVREDARREAAEATQARIHAENALLPDGIKPAK